jgi:CheY-like chemotaxis protein
MEKVIHILLVEDDELDVIDIRRTLDKMNIVYQLQHARNGEEGLRLLEAGLPDVALVDINMPKINGIEFLQAVRAHPEWKGLKCFIITTSDEKVDRVAAGELGISGYIVKPLKINNPSSMDAFNLMIDLMNMRN